MDDMISRQAAINALIRKRQPVNNGDGTITITMLADEVIRDVLNELPSVQPQRWIDVRDAVPEDERRVLCTEMAGEFLDVEICRYIQRSKIWLPEVHGNHNHILAWMPLPEPYVRSDMWKAKHGGTDMRETE